MPASVSLDPARNLVLTTFRGRLTYPEALEVLDILNRPPYTRADLLELADLGEVEAIEISTAQIRDIVTLLARSPFRRRTAVYAPSDESFGVARMFATLMNLADESREVAVFRAREEAHRFLFSPDQSNR